MAQTGVAATVIDMESVSAELTDAKREASINSDQARTEGSWGENSIVIHSRYNQFIQPSMSNYKINLFIKNNTMYLSSLGF